MMDVSTQHEMPTKTPYVPLNENFRDLGHRRERLFTTTSLLPRWHRSVCQSLQFSRPVDAGLSNWLRELAAERRRFGRQRQYLLLKREGAEIVHNGTLDPGVHLLSKPFTITTLARKMAEILSS